MARAISDFISTQFLDILDELAASADIADANIFTAARKNGIVWGHPTLRGALVRGPADCWEVHIPSMTSKSLLCRNRIGNDKSASG
jgi:hypothetical protein